MIAQGSPGGVRVRGAKERHEGETSETLLRECGAAGSDVEKAPQDFRAEAGQAAARGRSLASGPVLLLTESQAPRQRISFQTRLGRTLMLHEASVLWTLTLTLDPGAGPGPWGWTISFLGACGSVSPASCLPLWGTCRPCFVPPPLFSLCFLLFVPIWTS